jgi:hypothetical protein
MKNSNNNNVLSKKNKSVLRIAAAAKPVLLLLIVTSLTVPVMFSSLPLAAADAKADCEKNGGKYVVTNGKDHCFVTIEPDCHKLPPGEVVPDPELCLKSGGVVNNPISVGDEIAEIVEDTLNEIMPVIIDGNLLTDQEDGSDDEIIPVVSDGNLISESVRNTVNGVMPVVTDGNL